MLMPLLASSAIAAPAPSEKLDPQSLAFFEQKIRPVLVEHCYKCHSADAKTQSKLKGKLFLDTREGLLKGGDTGPSIVPGNAERSLLIEALRFKNADLEMPPKGKLPEAVIADFVKWVDMGAPDPRAGQVPTAPGAAASHDIAKVKAEHWAYQPLREVAAPRVKDEKWGRGAIDSFILKKLEDAKITPAAEAAPLTWLRRVYLDLIGLPPTPAEQAAFIQSLGVRDRSAIRNPQSENAYARVVDDLLARPQYGERWARHWLDVARYAETKGYERDDNKPHTWRYRDWAIDAFNSDKPYDRFIAEQIAGDEVEDASSSTHIAMTFLALGPFDTIANDGNRARYDQLDDILGTTSVAFLGQTLACARCHDHKFEPLSQEDYYRLLGAFEPLKTSDLENKNDGRPVGVMGEQKANEQRLAEIEREGRAVRGELEAIQLALLERLEKDGPAATKAKLEARHFARILPPLRTPIEKRTKEQMEQLARDANKITLALADYATGQELTKMKSLLAQVATIEAKRPKPLLAWAPEESGTKPKATRLLIRGESGKPGAEVSFGLPRVLEPSKGDLPAVTPTANTSGRRLWLARWMVNEGKGLTARVMVNRIWQYHLGQGFMEDANDFGVKAPRPSHPDLLNWLANDFVKGGWQIKRLHRQIVLSSVYRQSSGAEGTEARMHEGTEGTADPDNALFSRFPQHRLEAEAIRDSILAVSGKLNLKMHGPSVFPPFENKVVGDSSGVGWGTSDESEASRRSVYVYQKRAIPLPELFLLGLPDASVSCGKRAVSTTPVQSLLLLNGKFAGTQAAYMAARLRKEAGEECAAQVRLAFSLVLCRPPTEQENAIALAFLGDSSEAKKKDANDSLIALCLVLMNTNEFVYRN
jgi:cytochrome c553